MPIISAVGPFYFDKFEETPNEKVVNMLKLTKPYFKSKSCPLIMWPHGGPHSVTLKDFKNEFIFWLKLGFAVLLPNYRGSLGNGQKGVFALTKHAGNFDVKDCYQALQGNI